MIWLKNLLFKNKNVKILENKLENKQLNGDTIIKHFCAKPIGYICLGDETDEKCGNCGHWIS